MPASISVTGSGGDIDWYSDSTLLNLIKDNSTSYTHGQTAVGSYYYWVNETGGNGCVSPDTMVTLTINPLPLKNQAVSDPVICAGQTASITMNNSQLDVTYQLRNNANDNPVGAPQSGTGGMLTFNVTPASTITYNILATNDTTGCDNELTDKAVVTVHPLANITGQPPSRTICEYANTTFGVTASGPIISYQWYEDPNTGTFSAISNGGIYSGATTATLTLTGVTAGMNNYKYRVEVITTGPCPKVSNQGTLHVNPAPLDKNVIADDYYLCYGNPTSIVVQSSENGIVYDFRIGTDVKDSQTGNTANLDYPTGNLQGDTTYNVLARNTVTGCSFLLSDKPRVNVNPELTANLSVALPDICFDTPIDLPAVNVTGGSGSVSYAWTGTDAYTSTLQDPASFMPSSSGGHSYNVVVTDEGFLTESGGVRTCTASDNTSFNVNPMPLDRTVQVVKQKICYNTSTSVRIVNSEAGVEYQVKNVATDANVGAPVAGTGANVTVPTGNLTVTTQYKVLATRVSATPNCVFELTDRPTVTVNNDLSVVAAVDNNNICMGGTISLSSTPAGGTTNYTFTWSGPDGFSSGVEDPGAYTPVSSGIPHTFTILVEDDFNPSGGGTCSASDDVTVNVYNPPSNGITPADPTICVNINQVLNGNPVAGSGPITGHLWTGDTGPLSAVNVAAPTFNTATPGVYNLTYTTTDSHGCDAVDNVTVTVSGPKVNPLPGASTGVCAGNNLALDGNPSGGTMPYTHLWTGDIAPLSNANIRNPVFNSPGTGVFNVNYTVTDNAGCKATAPIVVTVSQVTASPLPAAPAKICTGNNLALNGNPAGGTGIYPVHLWTPGANPQAGVLNAVNQQNVTFNAATPGTYTYDYYVEDQNGCSYTESGYQVVAYLSPVADAGTGGVTCGLTFSLSATQSVPAGNRVNYTGEWTLTSGPGTASYASGQSSPSTDVTVTVYGSYQFTWTETNGTGLCSDSETITVTFYQQPAANAGIDKDVCGSKSTPLAATGFAYAAAPNVNSGTRTWQYVSGPDNTPTFSNASAPASNVTVDYYGTYEFRFVEDNGGICTDADTVKVRFYEQPVTSAGSDIDECDALTTNLAGTGFAYSGGLNQNSGTRGWEYVTGPDNTPVFGDATNPATSVTVGLYGRYTFRFAESNGTCDDADTVQVSFYEQPSIEAGPDSSVCGSKNITLYATSYTYLGGGNVNFGAGLWTYVSGPDATPAFSDPSSPVSGVTVDYYGVYRFRYTETNGSCSASDIVQVTFFQEPVANAGVDKSVCGSLNTPLAATAFTYAAAPNLNSGTRTWSYVSGPDATPSFSSLSSPTATVTVDNYGHYQFRYTETNGTCSDDDIVSITFNEQPTAVAGLDQQICDALTTNLNATAFTYRPAPDVNAAVRQWTYVSGPDNTPVFGDPADPHSSVDVSFYGTYQFRYTETNGTCSDDDVVQVTFSQQPVADAGADIGICAGKTANLTGSAFLYAGGVNQNAGTRQWQYVDGPDATPSFAAPASATSTVSVDYYGTYHFRFVETNGSCQDADTVEVSWYEEPSAEAGPNAQVCNALTTNMAATPYSYLAAPNQNISTRTWSYVSGPDASPVFSDANSPVSGVSVTAYGTYRFMFTETNGTCSDADVVDITFYEQPVANAGIDIAECGVLSTGLNATAYTYLGAPNLNSGNRQWSYVSGPDNTPVFTNPANPSSIVTVGLYGTYQFRYTETNGTCSANDVVQVIFYQLPTVAPMAGFTVCRDSSLAVIPISGTFGGGAGTASWSVLAPATGSIINESQAGNTITAEYLPGYDDLGGNAVLRLTTDDPTGPCAAASNDLVLHINEAAWVDAGPDTVQISAGSTLALNGIIAGGSSTGTWTVVSAPAEGTFTPGPNSLNATFDPSDTQDAIGFVTLRLTSDDPDGIEPCVPVFDDIVIHIGVNPVADARFDSTMCSNDTIYLSGRIRGSANTGTWSTPDGAGSVVYNDLVDDSIVIGYYVADAAQMATDVARGYVTFRLTTDDPDGAGPVIADFDDKRVNINPLPDTTPIGGPSEACIGTPNLFFSVTLTPGSYYDWTWGASLGTRTFGGDGLNSNALVINASPLPASDTIRVLETNQYGCTGTEVKKQVTIQDRAPVSDITGPSEVCDREENVKFTIPQYAGSTYQWFVPTGSGIVSVPNIDSVFVNFGSISGQVKVIETNSAGCVINHNPLFVTINPLPAASITVTKTNICTGEGVTFTAGPAGAANYEFFVDSISVQSGPLNTYATNSLTNGQQVFVNVTTIKGCSKASSPITMNVFDNPMVNLTSSDADDMICAGTSITFTAAAPGAVSYHFFLNSASVQNSALSAWNTGALNDGDSVYVIGTTALGCTGTSNVIETVVNPLPVAVLSGTSVICPADSAALTVEMSSGTGPFEVSISNGVGPVMNYNSTDPIYVHPVSLTVYSLTQVTDANSCSVSMPTANLTGTATISLNTNTAVLAQPHDGITCEESDTSFSVVVTGTGATVRWQADTGSGFADLADVAGIYNGTGTPVLRIINPASSLDGNLYRAVVTGTCGAPVTSDSSLLTVLEKPEITGQPVAVTVCEDGDAYFAVSAGVTTVASYQWQVFNGSVWISLNNGLIYDRVNTDTLRLSGIAASMNGSRYRVMVSGSCTPAVASNEAVLTVFQKPEISLQPSDKVVCEGQPAGFTLGTGVTTAPSVQWQVFDGSSWNDASGGSYSGENTTALDINPAVSAMNGYLFRAVVSGTCTPADTTSEAELTVKELPEVALQPVDVTSCEGDTVSFVTDPGVTTNPSLQWQVSTDNGVNWNNVAGIRYSGANTTTLFIDGIISSMHNYRYRARITGDCGPAAVTGDAVLYVNEKPEITLQPVNQAVCEGGNAVYTVATGVTTNPVIQWQEWDGSAWSDVSGAPYGGETTATLTVNGVISAMDGFRYRAYIEGACSPAVFSNPADLIVQEEPEITNQPHDTAVCEGIPATFTVDPGVTTSPAYQWFVSSNGGSTWNPVAGAGYTGINSATLAVTTVSTGMDGWLFRAEVSGTCPNPVTSTEAELIVYELPEISLQPVNDTVCEDGTAMFTVEALPTTAPVYSWEVNQGSTWNTVAGPDYSGQGTTTLTITNVVSAMSGYQYRVTISGTCNPAVISDVVNLIVREKPEVILQPADREICENDNTTFNVSAGVTTNPAYSWEMWDGSSWSPATGGVFSNENTPVLILAGVPSSMDGYHFRAVISGICAPEDTSAEAVLTVNERPEITSQPADVTECEDADVYFAVSAGVTTVPSYQWQIFNGSSWVNLNNGMSYSGVNTDTFRITGITPALNGNRYRVMVSGTCTPAVPSAQATLTVLEKPEITLQPADATECEGQPATFTLATGVTTAPAIQWQVYDGSSWTDASGAPFSGETTTVLTVDPVTSAMNGNLYRAVVSGSCAPEDTTMTASLTVRELPEIILQPSGLTACEGDTVTFGIDPGVTTNPAIQWQVSTDNGVNWNIVAGIRYTGMNSTVLQINGIISAMHNNRYRAVVTGDCGPSATSAEALLQVNEKPEFTLQPADQVICEGGDAIYSVSTGVTTMPVIQWQVWDGTSWSGISGAPYSGETTTVLTVTGVTSAMNNYRYRAYLEGTCAPAINSNAAGLTVEEQPEIIVDPVDAAVCEGLSASFSVDPGVTTAPSIQWYISVNGGSTWDPVAGAGYSGINSTTLTVFTTDSGMDGWLFRAEVSGTCPNPVTSAEAELTIYEQPEITIQPVNDTVCEDGTAHFTVDATPTTAPVYYWEVNDGGSWYGASGVRYAGQGTPMLTVSNVTPAMSGYLYRVTISGTCNPDVESGIVSLIVKEKPEVTLQPSDAEICENDGTSFTVSAGVTTNPQYAWEVYDGSTWNAAAGAMYSGANTQTLNLTGVPSFMEGYRFRVVISGDCAPAATSASALLSVNEMPEVTDDPDNVVSCEDDTVMFAVSAGVTTNPLYKWQVYNGSTWSVITGGKYTGYTTDTLRINGTASYMNGFRYRALINGKCSPADTSASALLTVREKPEISLQPVNSTVCEGSPAIFETAAGVTTGPAYTWEVDPGTGIFVPATIPGHSGNHTQGLSIAAGTSMMNGYRYRVIVQGACAPSDTSDIASLYINEKPEVITGPRDTTVCEGSNIAFTVNPGVTTAPLYQWEYNAGAGWNSIPDGGNVMGANSRTVNIYNVDSAMTGYLYRVVINGTCAPAATSLPAELTVNTSPVISMNPADVTICEGMNTTFGVAAVGTMTVFNWQLDKNDGMGFRDFADTAGVYSGTGTQTLTVHSAGRRLQGYRYRARVEGSCNPFATSTAAILHINTPPEIQAEPVDYTTCEYGNVTFNIMVNGTGLNYIWQESSGGPFVDLEDTATYTGTHSSSMSIFNVNRDFSGNSYRVIVSGTCNPPVVSAEAALTIKTSPVVTMQPEDTIVCENGNAAFIVTAAGSDLVYQWQYSSGGSWATIVDNAQYSGATTAQLDISGAGTGLDDYKYRVRITGSCVPPATSNEATLTVNQNPVIMFNPVNAEICENGSTSFTGSASGANISYQWQVFSGGLWQAVTDDIHYSGSQTMSLSITNAPVSFNGNQYRLSVSSACTAVNGLTATLTVNANPIPAITGDGAFPFVCGGTSLNLDGNASGGSGTFISHSWNGDTGPLSSVTTMQTVFKTGVHGTYDLVYKVTDSKGCSGKDTVTIENNKPSAQFSSDAAPSCGYRFVHFTNSSSRAVSYEWNFDDGSAIETGTDATHGFDNYDPLIRSFNIKLTAETAEGCRDSATQIITIYPKVDASFTVDPDTGCQPVVAMMVSLPGAASYYWDYGDNTPQETGGYFATHEFSNTTTATQTYEVTLKTTSFYGCVATDTQYIMVYPMPTPNFSVAPVVQTFPAATVQVNSLVPAGPWTYDYSFGDSAVSSETNPEHTYDEAGTFKITQRISVGTCIDSISQTVIIKPTPPVAGFDMPEAGCSPRQVQFHNTSMYANSYLWDFGDGSISTKKDPIYTFFEAGTYSVTLTVTGPGGSDSYKADITIWPTPSAFFNYAPDSVYVNDKPVKYFNYSSSANNYHWDFGDVDDNTGEISSVNASGEFEPTHVYESIGWKDVLLIVSNDHCADTLLRKNAVFVSPAGGLRFPNVFRPNTNGPSGGYYDPNDPASKNSVFFPGVINQVLDYHLYIYNRWGELIFSSDEVNYGWDGYIKGTLAKQGVYIWKVKGKYTNGKNFVEAGDVTLLH